jgi:hypothetical protein
MSNMIGVKSGVDWSKAPEGATDWSDNGEWYKDVNGIMYLWYGFGDYTWGECANRSVYGSSCFISKQDDLPQQEQEKEMEYKCLQDLPVGTFVKFKKAGDNYTCVWTGETLATMAPQQGHSRLWDEFHINTFEGFDYKVNSAYNIISYSDRYEGEYKSLVQVKASTPWKIKHLKSPTYTCGKDVALTILYRVVDSGVQYKYSICSKEDMFCKRTGIEVANNSTIYSYNPYSDCTTLQAALYSLTQQSVSRQVKKLINDFLNSK